MNIFRKFKAYPNYSSYLVLLGIGCPFNTLYCGINGRNEHHKL